MIQSYLEVFIVFALALITVAGEPATVRCPIGFTAADELDYCYRLKPPELFTDTYKDCEGNLFTIDLLDQLKLTREKRPVWTDLISVYPGGPFTNWTYNFDAHFSDDVIYDFESISLNDDYCVIMETVSNFTAVKCREQKYPRYCIVKSFNTLERYEELPGFYRFRSPRSTSLSLVTKVRTNWSNAQSSICEKRNSSVLQRGWRYANLIQPSVTEYTYPMGIFMTSANTLLWIAEENGNNTVPDSEYSFDDIGPHSDDQSFVAIRNDSWMFVSNTQLFHSVVCEHPLPKKIPKMHVYLDTKQIFLLVDAFVAQNHIMCFTDSLGIEVREINKNYKMTTENTSLYKVRPLSDGYYWCKVKNSDDYQTVHSNKVLYIKNPEKLRNTYAVKIKMKKKYKFKAAAREKISEDYISRLKEYIFKENKPAITKDIVRDEEDILDSLILRNHEKKVYLDRRTVLLHLDLNNNAKPVPPGVFEDLEIIYMKPVYFCSSPFGNASLGESFLNHKEARNLTCVGDFTEGVQFIETALEEEYPSSTSPSDMPRVSETTVPSVGKNKSKVLPEFITATKPEIIPTSTTSLLDIPTEITTTDSSPDDPEDPLRPDPEDFDIKYPPVIKPTTKPPLIEVTTINHTTDTTETTEITTDATTVSSSLPPDEQLLQVIEDIDSLLANEEPVSVESIEAVFVNADDIFGQTNRLEIPGRLLQMLDTLGTRADVAGNNTNIVVNNIAMVLANAGPSYPVRGLRITTSDDNNFRSDAFQLLMGGDDTIALSNDIEAQVNLPESLSDSNRRISFVVFRSGQTFQGYNDHTVNSKVVSIKVENLTHFDKDEYIDIQFRPHEYPERNETRRCVFWEFLDGDNGTWSDAGCQLIETGNDSLLDICRCDHLTHFAEILVSKSIFSEEDEYALEIISIMGCFLSIFGLTFVCLTALLFRSWRRDFTNKIWLQLCVSIFILCLCFLIIVFARFDHYSLVCMLTGVALHYAVLASFCWMTISAILSYRRLVLVFTRDVSHKLLKAAAFCWGFPLAVIGILLSVDPHSYETQFEDKFSGGSFCYPTQPAIWATVYAPIAVMLLVNWTLFVLIVRSVFIKRDHTINRHGDSKEAVRCASVSCLLVFLFGLPWLFGLFSKYVAFAYLFNITATFQGLILFIFFILGNKKTRDMWLNLLKIKQTRGIPVTSSTYSHNKSSGHGWKSGTTAEANLSKPRSLASPDNSRFS